MTRPRRSPTGPPLATLALLGVGLVLAAPALAGSPREERAKAHAKRIEEWGNARAKAIEEDAKARATAIEEWAKDLSKADEEEEKARAKAIEETGKAHAKAEEELAKARAKAIEERAKSGSRWLPGSSQW
jgi:Tfp pilus assembly protein FimT